MPDATILVLGCGLGGVVAAREVRKRLSRNHRVVVIDREAQATFPPSFPWVVVGSRRAQSLKRRRAELNRHGVEFVAADVTHIDLKTRHVRAEGREFHYDYLVIALGTETTFDSVPGLADAAQTFYSVEGAERLAAALRYFSKGRIVIVVPRLPYKGPAAPYEMAMLLEEHFRKRRVRDQVELHFCTPEKRPLAVTGAENGELIAGLLQRKGIGFYPDRELISVADHSLRFRDGDSGEFEMLIAVPEHRAPGVVFEAGLTDLSGWVPVDHATLETRVNNVFAVGDVTHFELEDGEELPKLGVLAERQAITAARNIVYRIKSGSPPPPYSAKATSFIEVGDGAAAIFEGDYLAHPREIRVRPPSIIWHWAKRALDRYWLWRWY